ncbi:type IV secretion protein DotG [Alphaproteobacteria bacterium]|nr:type IV secretion protein DotG [Alphaproteobacteria bacterium]
MIDDDKNQHEDELEEVMDFDDDEIDLDDDDNFDDFDDPGITLGDTLRDKPIVKFAIIAGVIFLVIGIFLFFRSGPTTPTSVVAGPSDVNSAPGTGAISQNYENAVREADAQRLAKAKAEDTGFLPTPIETPLGRVPLPRDEEDEEDPLERWRRLQQERAEKEAERANLLAPEDLSDEFISDDAIQAMADAMAAQMQIILEGLGEVPTEYTYLTGPDYLEALRAEEEEAKAEALAALASASGTVDGLGVAEIIVPAGEIIYGQLLLEANSDVPGPVLAQIAGGPLSGSRVLGAFSVAEELIVLEFSTIVIDGVSQSISAVAIDPGTTLTGLATDVDHRYFTRIVLPAAAAFVEGAAQAVSDSGRTTITISGDSTTSTTSSGNTGKDEEIASGVEEAAEVVGEILEEMADDAKILVRIEAGTPIGLLFLEPVLKE